MLQKKKKFYLWSLWVLLIKPENDALWLIQIQLLHRPTSAWCLKLSPFMRFRCGPHADFPSFLLWLSASMSLSLAFVPGRNTAIQPHTHYSGGFKHTLFLQRAPPNLWQCRNILVNNMTPQDWIGVRFFFFFSPATRLAFLILWLFIIIRKYV